jgi:pimeloyl-ACP methyl ester carboxylesterase
MSEGADHDVAVAWPSGERTQFFDVGGYAIAYVEAGTCAPPVLLVHGSTSDYRVWYRQLSAFAERFRTIAPSLRHCHPERWNGVGDDFTVEQHADDLAAFVRGRALGATHVVGHSRGGAVAIELALRAPQLVRTLVLADPGGLERLLPDTPEGLQMARQTAQMFARLRENLATRDEETAAREFVDTLGGEGTWSRRTPEQRRIVLDNIRTGPACEQRPSFTGEQIASIAVPMLLVTGSRSPVRYRPICAAISDANPRVAAIVTIDNAAHAMNRENPTAFNAAVLDFLARH